MHSILALAALLTAQAAPVVEVELAPGIQGVRRVDQLSSPLPYTGVLPDGRLGTAIRADRWVHRAELAVGIGSMRSQAPWTYTWDGDRRTTEATPATMVDLRYAVGRRWQADGWNLAVGATSSNHVEAIDLVYNVSYNFSYLGTFGLGPWVEAERSLGRKHHVALEAWAPLAAWVTRSPYAINDADFIYDNRDHSPVKTIGRHIAGGHVETLNRLQVVDARASWSFTLHDHWQLVTTAQVSLIRETQPRTLTSANLGARVGVKAVF